MALQLRCEHDAGHGGGYPASLIDFNLDALNGNAHSALMHGGLARCALVSFSLAMSAPAFCEDGLANDRPGWRLQIDNDSYGLGHSTDRWYTNGIRFSYALSPSSSSAIGPNGARAAAESLCALVGCTSDNVAYGVVLGQNIYTPNRIDRAAPNPRDRLWAGWLYLGGTLAVAQKKPSFGTLSVWKEDYAEFLLGVVGPASQADTTQKHWHHLINATEPRGWDNQLRNEVTAQFNYRRAWRLVPESHAYDIVPSIGIGLGTVMVYASTALQVRVGRNIQGFGDTDPRPHEREWYLFGRVEQRAVAHNMFIDGNNFRHYPEDSQISRRTFVSDASLGFGVGLGAGWKVLLAQTWRSAEFDADASGGQPSLFVPDAPLRRTQAFISVAITYVPK